MSFETFYDILDMNQNLTDWVGSLPILYLKGTTRKTLRKLLNSP